MAKKTIKTSKKKAAKKTTKKTQGKGAPQKSTTKSLSSSKSSTSTSATAGKSKPSNYQGIGVGESVPAFQQTATSATGGPRTINQNDLRGNITVLYFYPKDNTPGCTLEGQDFKRRFNDLVKLGVQVLGVSRDSMKAHENFKLKCGFPFDLIADENEVLCKMFDVIQMKSLYGRKFEGIERSTFVIDSSGKLRREWRKVKVNGHVAEVIDYIRRDLAKK